MTDVTDSKGKNLLKAVMFFAVGATVYGYYQSRQDIKEAALACPAVIEAGKCDCVVDAFDQERGLVRGIVVNIPIVNLVVNDDPQRLGGYMRAGALSCNAKILNENEANG